ncbi:MAG: CBS domain-containing protein [Methylophilus sp.]|nr:CBS domain-containing protein [Methylophilus sp.]
MKTLQQVLNDKKHKGIISISPDKTVFDALVLLAEHNIGALAVMHNDKLVGVFSERDYARELALKGRSSKTTLIRDIMTTSLIIARPNDLLDSAMNTMSDKRIRHLPVLEGEVMVGMLSVGDLVKETISYQASLIQQLESYITGG